MDKQGVKKIGQTTVSKVKLIFYEIRPYLFFGLSAYALYLYWATGRVIFVVSGVALLVGSAIIIQARLKYRRDQKKQAKR